MYYCDFLNNTYGNLSFADVMLGDSIEYASKKLSPYYKGDVEEKLNGIKPSIMGDITPFDDKYMTGVSISVYGNPVKCIELKAHFKSFPYDTFGFVEGMELSISDEDNPYMEVTINPQWFNNEDGVLLKKERRMQMHNLLCDYYSYVGLNSDGFTTIGIKVELPKHHLSDESEYSVFATYKSVNKVVRYYRQELKSNRLLRKDDKGKIVF